jgi:hypothetical protein
MLQGGPAQLSCCYPPLGHVSGPFLLPNFGSLLTKNGSMPNLGRPGRTPWPFALSVCRAGEKGWLTWLLNPFPSLFCTCVTKLFWAALQEEALLTLAWPQGSQGPQRVLMLQVVLASAGR